MAICCMPAGRLKSTHTCIKINDIRIDIRNEHEMERKKELFHFLRKQQQFTFVRLYSYIFIVRSFSLAIQ